ncbi:SGNH/GDSL hydrolase family protein [Planctomicrobium sp. SH661]|uniref:SGNH/GDSL hydrolase family protein n=1 Tax=Planctomicrobium sp. SH661 TaxID=3448124 RepID=UPI003F5B95B3
MRACLLSWCLGMLLMQGMASGAEPSFPLQAKRIVFLGDSITHAGHVVTQIEAQLLTQRGTPLPEIINLGLPSETASGLSEPAHPFPRPGVHERLARALKTLHPDVVVVCYGMNDGIYAPFSEERFQTYQTAILKLVDEVHAAGAKVVLLTPPPFDPLPARKSGALKGRENTAFDWVHIYEGYDEEVMVRYAAWIMEQKDKVEMVVDVRSPVLAYVAEKRKTEPDFVMSGDGVHLNDEGQAVIAGAVLTAWGVPGTTPDAELLQLVDKKQSLQKHTWLNEVGHQRPGMPAGLPIAELKQQVSEIDQQIQQRLKQLQK